MAILESDKPKTLPDIRERIEEELIDHASSHEHQEAIARLAEELSVQGHSHASDPDILFSEASIQDIRKSYLGEESPLTDIDIARAIALSGVENQRSIEIKPRRPSGSDSLDASPEEEGLLELKEFLIDLRGALQGPVDSWIANAKQYLEHHQQALHQHPESYNPLVRGFLETYVDDFVAIAEKEQHSLEEADDLSAQDLADRVLHFTHELSDVITKDMNLIQEKIVPRSMSVADIIRDNPDRLRREGSDLMVYSKDSDEWFTFPLPQSDGLLHKGGFPRVMLKIAAGAPDVIIESELPVNDIDVIIDIHSNDAMDEVRALEIEREGVEEVAGFDMKELMAARDATVNSCLQGGKETFFSEEAFQSVKTGKMRLLEADRGIYGCDHFYVEGEVMFGPRALSRAMNQLVQVKSLHMDFNKRNAGVDLGVYWLVLARKFGGKDNAPELLDRMHDIGKQLGQVREGEQDIFDVLDRVHAEHPYYDFGDSQFTDEQVAGWLFGKFCKQVDKHFRNSHQMSAPRSVDAAEGDLQPYEVRVNLDAEAQRSSLQNDVRNSVYPHRWQRLMERSAVRTQAYKESQKF